MDNVYIVEGKNITDLDSLFKEFAKAVNAPNGYFGNGLEQFDDCLFGGYGLIAPCKIIWKDSNFSKQKLDGNMLEKYYEEVINYCEEELIKEIEELKRAGLNPDKYSLYYRDRINYCLYKVRKARNGQLTMFEEVTQRILSVTKRAHFSDSWVVDLILE